MYLFFIFKYEMWKCVNPKSINYVCEMKKINIFKASARRAARFRTVCNNFQLKKSNYFKSALISCFSCTSSEDNFKGDC